MARQNNKKNRKKSISRRHRLFLPTPLIIFLLLCVGVFLMASTLRTGADDIFVNAKVSGPPVTSPASITNPVDAAHFSNIPINVSGTCPTNAAYVEIYRNNLMSGVALCSGGAFSLSVDLFSGQNLLVAHVFNITDDEGPVSGAKTVYYDPPRPAISQNNSTPTSQKSNPLTLKTAFLYKGYYVGDKVEWPLEITGGVAPYVIKVDWGDGQVEAVNQAKEGQFTISHTYSQPAANKAGDYTIKVNATDSDDGIAHLQFFVIVNAKQQPAAAGTGNIFSKPPPALTSRSWLWVAWPAYAITTVMIISYILGEKAELAILSKRGLLRR